MHFDVYCLYLYQAIDPINQGVLEKDISQECFIMKSLTRHLKNDNKVIVFTKTFGYCNFYFDIPFMSPLYISISFFLQNHKELKFEMKLQCSVFALELRYKIMRTNFSFPGN